MIDHDTRFIFFLSRLFLFFSFSFFFHRLDSIQWILLVIYNTMEITFPYIILYFRNVRGSTHHFKLAYQHAIDPYDSFIIFQTIQLPWFRMKRKNNSHRYHWTYKPSPCHIEYPNLSNLLAKRSFRSQWVGEIPLRLLFTGRSPHPSIVHPSFPDNEAFQRWKSKHKMATFNNKDRVRTALLTRTVSHPYTHVLPSPPLPSLHRFRLPRGRW